MEIFTYIAFITTGLYALIIFSFSYGWLRIKKIILSFELDLLNTTIIIAFRNEEHKIENLLDALVNQTYPKDFMEIILVDDHSEDNTVQIIEKYIKHNAYIKLLKLPDQKTGKKNAIAYGVQNSSSEIIITTDADCVMSENWVLNMMNYYVRFKPRMISGPVAFSSSKCLFQQLQSLEFMSLVGTGAGAIGINKPIMNNAANLLFEKSLFLNSELQHKFVSGDDMFLLLHAKKLNRKAIHFLKSKDAVVYTQSENSFYDFFQQRIRWTSKSKGYHDLDVIITALIVTLTNLILAISLVYSAWNISLFKIFTILFFIKSVGDLSILVPTSIFFNKQKLLWYLLPLQIIYPFYINSVVFFGWLGNFSWKSRTFK